MMDRWSSDNYLRAVIRYGGAAVRGISASQVRQHLTLDYETIARIPIRESRVRSRR